MSSKEKPKSKLMPIILILIVLSSIGYGVSKYIYSLHHEDTDDAQIDADISPVLCRVTGYVQEINFEDNSLIKKGDTLIKLDDRDLSIKVAQANAAIQNADAGILIAQASVGTAQSNVNVMQSGIENAKVRLWKATQDFNRYDNLLKANSITQVQFDAAKAEKESAEVALLIANNQLQVSQKQVFAAQQQIASAQAQKTQRIADLNFANLQLSYTTVVAPATGRASKKNVQLGQLVNAGNPLCAIVSNEGVYVMANFKETQLDKMKEGQPVEIIVDAFSEKKITGKIYRLSAATGAKFSLLPPDNATGNFVKVVQRVPVKIKLDEKQELINSLRPGMSVKVSVTID